jgi:hypothetical protein
MVVGVAARRWYQFTFPTSLFDFLAASIPQTMPETLLRRTLPKVSASDIFGVWGNPVQERINNSQKEVPDMWSSFGASIGATVEKGPGPEGIVLTGRLVLKRTKPT